MMRSHGINFQVVPPSPPDRLARMDVAAFVGFAASGPVDTPVPVEDPVYFTELFGADQELAWDPYRGQPLSSHLGPAVRAFFRNGGRRCWVVRVADQPATNRFPLPGLMQWSAGGYRGVEMQARAPGSWSDGLRVGTVLESAAVGEAAFDGDFAATRLLRVTQEGRTPIRAGDLLRIRLDDGLLLYFAVADARELTDAVHRENDPATAQWRVRGEDHWFRTVEATSRQPDEEQPRTVQFRRLDPPGDNAGDDIWQGAEGGWAEVPPSRGRSWLAAKSPALLRIGNLLEVEDPQTHTRTLLAATEVDTEVVQGVPNPYPYYSLVKGWAPLTPVARPDGPTLAGARVQADRLTLTLWVEDEHGRTDTIAGLGFMPGHPRFLGSLPADTQLFQPHDERSPLADEHGSGGRLWAEVAYPRFPLAAVPVPLELAGAQLILPIGTDRILWKDIAGTAPPQRQSKLERDGLGRFDPAVFLDPDLRETPADTLQAMAFTKRHTRMQKLRGAHALLPVDEVTLLSLPDLGHTGWTAFAGPAAPPRTAPVLVPAAGAPPGRVRLMWESVDSAQAYTAQSAEDGDFTQCVASHDVTGIVLDLPAPAGAGRQTRYFRVRVRGVDRPGPWSNTVSLQFPHRSFNPREHLEAPKLVDKDPLGNVHRLTWIRPAHATCLLQTAADPDFANPATYYQGPGQECLVWRTGQNWAYYRVRACRGGEESPWSNTVAVVPVNAATDGRNEDSEPGRGFVALEPPDVTADQPGRVAIHRALLRLCQARADLFAILSLPAAYRENDAIAYVRAVATQGGATEQRALGYGSFYYPWLVSETPTGEQRAAPPDGPVTGLIAGLSVSQGVWLPPAYKPLTGVTGLYHTTPLESYTQLLDEGINMVIERAEGILLRSAQSLSLDETLRPLNVRRLLMLIRRRTLREGNYLVFEPNSDAFRRAAERRFERMLMDLFVQGAFAGATPADSFKVSIDPALNTPEVREQGRLVIDLAVAPMQPLVFMTVRVVQAEGQEPVFSEGSA